AKRSKLQMTLVAAVTPAELEDTTAPIHAAEEVTVKAPKILKTRKVSKLQMVPVAPVEPNTMASAEPNSMAINSRLADDEAAFRFFSKAKHENLPLVYQKLWSNTKRKKRKAKPAGFDVRPSEISSKKRGVAKSQKKATQTVLSGVLDESRNSPIELSRARKGKRKAVELEDCSTGPFLCFTHSYDGSVCDYCRGLPDSATAACVLDVQGSSTTHVSPTFAPTVLPQASNKATTAVIPLQPQAIALDEEEEMFIQGIPWDDGFDVLEDKVELLASSPP
ncbi:hypothetical protein BGZ75_002041, partial [Mortierella antarctica]